MAGSRQVRANYRELYKNLIQAYYNSHFEESFQKMLEEDFEDLDEAKQILSTLCGVDLVATSHTNFIQGLVDAITQNNVKEKIVQKVRNCVRDCESIEGKSKCQSVCPFDAIIKISGEDDKWIDESLCMSCGRCIAVCDKGNYLETPQFLPLAHLLKQEEQVIAIVAPAIAGQFGKEVTLDQLREALIQVGFKDMIEVAMAADVLSIKEALEFDAHVQKAGDFMITSCCCPMWVAALRKVYHKLVPDVSPSVSPMIAMARIIKALNKDTKVVFIGPCIAKKAEAKEKDLVGDVDYVLTFEELQIIFDALDSNPENCSGLPSIDYASTGGRLYARTGGVSQAVWDIVDQLYPKKRVLFSAVQVDGMKDCKTMLEDLEHGKVKASFIEGMGCKGGCVGGPKAIIDAVSGKEAVNAVAYDSAIKIPVHSQVLKELLKQIGIPNIEALKENHSMFERSFK